MFFKIGIPMHLAEVKSISAYRVPKWGHSPCTALTHSFVLMVIFREVGYVSQEDPRDLQRPGFTKRMEREKDFTWTTFHKVKTLWR